MAKDQDNKVVYDVALSFAGEDRKYAEMLAQQLRAEGVSVFYDAFEESKLWGENLYTYLADIYGKKAEYCVMFLSEHYAKKLWTSHERQFAQAKAFSENKAYILPVKVDDTEIPGIPSTVGYVDLRKISIDRIATLLLEKLGKSAQVTPDNPADAYTETVNINLDLSYELQHDAEELKVMAGEMRYNIRKGITPPFVLQFPKLNELRSELALLNKTSLTTEERNRKLGLKQFIEDMSEREEEITKCIRIMLNSRSLGQQLCIVNDKDLALAIKGLSEFYSICSYDSSITKLDLDRPQEPRLHTGMWITEEELQRIYDYVQVDDKWAFVGGGWSLLDLPLELVTYKAVPRIVVNAVRFNKAKLTDSEIEDVINPTTWQFGLG